MSTRPYNLLTDAGGLIPVAQGEIEAGTQPRPFKTTADGDQWIHCRDGENIALGSKADDTKITDPDAAEASALQLLRGLLEKVIGGNDRWDDSKDPTGTLRTIDTEQSKVNAGQTFKFQKVFNLTDTVGQRLHLKTNDKSLHWKKALGSANNDEVVIRLYEDATVDTQGTNEIPVLNCNRNSASEPSLDVYDDSTYTDDGTLLEEHYLPGADGPGQQSRDWGWVLKPNSDYMIKVERLDGTGATRVLAKFKFFEVEE